MKDEQWSFLYEEYCNIFKKVKDDERADVR